jgi:hypothetical protein
MLLPAENAGFAIGVAAVVFKWLGVKYFTTATQANRACWREITQQHIPHLVRLP